MASFLLNDVSFLLCAPLQKMPRNPLQVQHVLETMQIQPSYLQVAKQVAGTSKAGRGRAEAAASFSGVLQRVWSELAAYDDWIELAVSDSDYAAMEFAFAMDFAKAADPRQLPIFEKTPVVKLEGEDQLGDLLVLALVFGGSEVDQDLGGRLLAQLDRARVDVGVEQEGVPEDFLQLLPYPVRLFRGALLLLRVGRRERQQESVQFVLLIALEPLHGEVVLRLRQQHEHTEPVPTLAPSSAAR